MTRNATYQPVLEGLVSDLDVTLEPFGSEPAVFVVDADAGEPQQVGGPAELPPAVVELACDWIELTDGRRVAGPVKVLWVAREAASLAGAA